MVSVRLEGMGKLNGHLALLAKEIVPALYTKTVRFLALKILVGSAAKTPVDTGVLRGGWQLAINSPGNEERSPDKGGTGVVSSGEAAIAALTPGQSVWITNPVEYAPYVNDGTDKIEGKFMLERTIDEALGAFA